MAENKKRNWQYHSSWHDFYYGQAQGIQCYDIADSLETLCKGQYYIVGWEHRVMIETKSDATMLRLKGCLDVKGQKVTFVMKPKDDTVPELAKAFRKLLPNHKVKSKRFYGSMAKFGRGEIQIMCCDNDRVDMELLNKTLHQYLGNGQVKDCSHDPFAMSLHVY